MDLLRIREECGVSVDELAQRTGFTKNMIWNYQAGRRKPTPDALLAIADALGVSIDYLVRGKENEPHPEKRARLEDAAVDAFANLPQNQRDIALAVYSAVTAALQSQQK